MTDHRLPRAETDWDPKALIARAVDAGVAGDWPACQAISALAQAMALLQPTVEEVLAEYQSVAEETTVEVTTRLDRAMDILSNATRDGSRRHPAIHAALEVLRGT